MAAGGLELAVAPLLGTGPVLAAGLPTPPTPGATGERVAVQAASRYRVYCSKSVNTPDALTWVQIDLGDNRPIEAVRLYPSNKLFSNGDGFPVRFRIECAETPELSAARVIADHSRADYPDPHDHVIEWRTPRARGRYVRLTVTRLRRKKILDFTPDVPGSLPAEDPHAAYYLFALAKIDVVSGGRDIAVSCPVRVDEVHGDPQDAQQLTRPARPMGEGILTDNPQNVSAPETWHPVAYRAQAPVGQLKLSPGLFLTAFENNRRYLLESSSVEDLLHPFRERAGKPTPAWTHPPDPFWVQELAGSDAGRFLMGAANTLRWSEDAELRRRMNALVEGIAECREADGYIMGYPRSTFFSSERGAYTRSWLTHGLIDAGYSGNDQAFKLLRGYYDGYNHMSELPLALRACGQGGQGMVANTRLYFTPVGRPLDLQIIQRYFQENYWLQALAAREADAVWQYPYDHAHCYLLTNLEAYLDLYRATGEKRYLEGVQGGWALYRENWQHVGGSISIIEVTECPPKANALYEHSGEACGSAFWILLNHRLHLLNPDEEQYVSQIEKSIYNVMLANQSGARGIRYHTMLVGEKEKPNKTNTCCEGQGTRILASLPQYIYSIAADGLYVNLFEPSAITWQQDGEPMRLEMETRFPSDPNVRLKVEVARPIQSKLRVRTPSWATQAMSIEVNGSVVAQGLPGQYVLLDRQWSSGDIVSFVLPMGFKLTRYEGVDQMQGRERYALEYGPLLMAVLDAADAEVIVISDTGPETLLSLLKPVPDRPLHFVLPAQINPEDTRFVPYFEIESESFSCFPSIRAIKPKELYY